MVTEPARSSSSRPPRVTSRRRSLSDTEMRSGRYRARSSEISISSAELCGYVQSFPSRLHRGPVEWLVLELCDLLEIGVAASRALPFDLRLGLIPPTDES